MTVVVIYALINFVCLSPSRVRGLVVRLGWRPLLCYCLFDINKRFRCPIYYDLDESDLFWRLLLLDIRLFNPIHAFMAAACAHLLACKWLIYARHAETDGPDGHLFGADRFNMTHVGREYKRSSLHGDATVVPFTLLSCSSLPSFRFRGYSSENLNFIMPSRSNGTFILFSVLANFTSWWMCSLWP